MELSNKKLNKLFSSWINNKSVDRQKIKTEIIPKIVKRLKELSISNISMSEADSDYYNIIIELGYDLQEMTKLYKLTGIDQEFLESLLRNNILSVDSEVKDLFISFLNSPRDYFGDYMSDWKVRWELSTFFHLHEKVYLPIESVEELQDYFKDPELNKLTCELIELTVASIIKVIKLINYLILPGVTEGFIKKHNIKIYNYVKEVTTKQVH